MSNINWFPGHMAKTGRELIESAKYADLILEVLDARIPTGSGNPDFERLFRNRLRLVVMNKEDLADPAVSRLWKAHFNAGGAGAVFTNSKNGDGIHTILGKMKKIGAKKTDSLKNKGVISRPVRAIVAGIPNSGKSTLINKLAGKAAAKTGDRPGVTRSRQWIKLDVGIDLLDTPGVLWPKIENDTTAYNLAFTGAIRDEVINTVQIAEKLLEVLKDSYPDHVMRRYGISGCETARNGADIGGGLGADGDRTEILGGGSGADMGGGRGADGAARIYADLTTPLLDIVGKKRGFLLRGGEIDYMRASVAVLDEFRGGKIGRITLERPQGHIGGG